MGKILNDPLIWEATGGNMVLFYNSSDLFIGAKRKIVGGDSGAPAIINNIITLGIHNAVGARRVWTALYTGGGRFCFADGYLCADRALKCRHSSVKK